jgi:hypothetical protein
MRERPANTTFGPWVAEIETSLPAGRAGEGSQVVSGSLFNVKTLAHVGQADMGRGEKLDGIAPGDGEKGRWPSNQNAQLQNLGFGFVFNQPAASSSPANAERS